MGTRKKSEPIIWTEQTMRNHLQYFRSNPRYLLHNLYVFGWESDLLFLSKSGIWTELEIKVSRSDFLADLKYKTEKHSILADKENRMKPNRFYYAVPEGLVLQDEVPDYAGLLWILDSGCHSTVAVKPAPSLHNHKITPEVLKLADKFYFNMMNAKRDAQLAKNEMAAMKEPYDDGLRDGQRQGIHAMLEVIKKSCPYRHVQEDGRIHCSELNHTRSQICDRGLCDYLSNIEENADNELKRLFNNKK